MVLILLLKLGSRVIKLPFKRQKVCKKERKKERKKEKLINKERRKEKKLHRINSNERERERERGGSIMARVELFKALANLPSIMHQFQDNKNYNFKTKKMQMQLNLKVIPLKYYPL